MKNTQNFEKMAADYEQAKAQGKVFLAKCWDDIKNATEQEAAAKAFAKIDFCDGDYIGYFCATQPWYEFALLVFDAETHRKIYEDLQIHHTAHYNKETEEIRTATTAESIEEIIKQAKKSTFYSCATCGTAKKSLRIRQKIRFCSQPLREQIRPNLRRVYRKPERGAGKSRAKLALRKRDNALLRKRRRRASRPPYFAPTGRTQARKIELLRVFEGSVEGRVLQLRMHVRGQLRPSRRGCRGGCQRNDRNTNKSIQRGVQRILARSKRP